MINAATESYRRWVENTKGRKVRKINYNRLSKEDLINLGITNICKHDDEIGWLIFGYFKGQEIYHIDIKLIQGKKKKNGNTRDYYGITYKGKILSLASILYAWFIGPIEPGYVVDHIDNNNRNNDLSNLQLLTRGQNVKKESTYRNQFINSDEDALKYYQKKLNNKIEQYKRRLSRLEAKFSETQTRFNKWLSKSDNCTTKRDRLCKLFDEMYYIELDVKDIEMRIENLCNFLEISKTPNFNIKKRLKYNEEQINEGWV